MLHFESDYTTGCLPEILEALTRTNLESQAGYGADRYTQSAKEKIAAACGGGVAVELLSGGTQTNAVVIDTLLADYEGVIAAETGHIALHEAGAIEHSGHKVIPVAQREGKIECEALKAYLECFCTDENREHMVFPGMVYLSQPTEYGTLYTKKELLAIRKICLQYGLRLYADGARLAYALGSEANDVSLKDLAQICDVFYIGGTKAGALCGEAVVFCGESKPAHFLTRIKQRGALLAKGRVLGVQFDTLFTDDLYLHTAKKANRLAEALRQAFSDVGYREYIATPTNQKFLVLTDAQDAALREHIAYSFWERLDENHIVVRFATTWSTTAKEIESFKNVLAEVAV